MKLSICLAALAAAAGVTANPCLSGRPHIHPSPHEPRLPIPNPPMRHKFCVVKTHGVTDDSDYIMAAFHECNDGGHVLFPRESNYLIGTAMDWTFLKHIDIGTTSCLVGISAQPGFAWTDWRKQISRATSCSATTRTTGKRTRSALCSRTSPPSSSWEAMMCGSTAVSNPLCGSFVASRLDHLARDAHRPSLHRQRIVLSLRGVIIVTRDRPCVSSHESCPSPPCETCVDCSPDSPVTLLPWRQCSPHLVRFTGR